MTTYSPKRTRRDTPNMAAMRCGVPMAQAGIDSMWTAIASKLNATLPSSRETPIEARRASSTIGGARPIHAKVDWGSIAANLNAEAGLKAPTRIHGRHG